MRAIAILMLCLPLTARAADLDESKLAKIPERMHKFVDEHQISGAVTVVGTSKSGFRLDGVGLRDQEKNEPMKDGTLFRIASMTKPITAIGIMILVDEGKLKVEDPVEKHLPEFRGQMMVSKREKDIVTLKKPARPITLRDLLTHTSGLPGFPPAMPDLYAKRNLTLAQATLIMSQRPLEFEPGTKWAYCNTGIDTLGRIIEVVSGMPYEAFLAKRIFEPLGMKDTVFAPDAGQQERLAKLYGVKEKKLTPAPDSLIGPGWTAKHPIPAGGLYSTGPDLAKLYRMMLNKGRIPGGADRAKIISEESVAEMTKVHTDELKAGFVAGTGFGLGWAVVKKPEGVTAMMAPGSYGHGGAFGTQGWIDSSNDLFVVLLIQRVGLSNGDASDMRREFQKTVYEAIKK